MVELERIKYLNNKDVLNREKVIYWMQSSQRIEYNHALEYAINISNELGKDLVVYFGITENYPEANERHYYFMMEGLREIKRELEKVNIRMIIMKISPEKGIIKLLKHAALIVVDRGYLRHETAWRKSVADLVDCRLVQVETNVIVPVEVASPKEEYSAATLRRKLEKVSERFINIMPESKYLGNYSQNKDLPMEFEIEDINSAMQKLEIDRSVKRLTNFRGGTSEAIKHLESFLDEELEGFSSKRNDPSRDCCSNLSPYLHFGQISPLYIYLKILSYEADSQDYADSRKSFLEELFVRRELAINFVFYNKCYDSYKCLPFWVLKTLTEHSGDHREYLYSSDELEYAKTHDEYWNAAQVQMFIYGKMHGYMRMYWGKKILQWSKSPEQAYAVAIYLNNKYELDGRDPNGFAGVAWCFGKHDRPWAERGIFGKVRYMVYSGLKRKFDMEKYIKDFKFNIGKNE